MCSGCQLYLRSAYPRPFYPIVAAPVAVEVAAPPDPQPDPAPEVQVEADSYDDQDPTALQDFHSALDGHGAWIDDPTYGTVWTPNGAEVGADFVPYMQAGHWAYGDDYLWVSDYEWGWAPFHYGRWLFLDGRGWGWIPGREYAPAWVEWRTGDEYVGWAPAGPSYIWRGGVAVTEGFIRPEPRYVFCGHQELFSAAPGREFIAGPRAVELQARTRAYAAPEGGHHGRGPAPASLGIPPAKIAHPTGHEAGLARAQGFARPSTARPLGGHPPVRQVAATSSRGQQPGRGEAAKAQARTAVGRESAGREPGKSPASAEAVRSAPTAASGQRVAAQPVRAAPVAPRPAPAARSAPPAAAATTGRPDACASTATIPNSSMFGITSARARG